MFGGGGFAGDAGQQFAGGGFMPSQAHDTGYGSGGGGVSAGGKKNTTLRTLTIRQLAKDLANVDDDTHVVDGADLANVTVIGKILNVTDRNTNMVLLVTDGTGELEINYWLQEETEQAIQSKKAELQPGVYIKAHGHMRTFDKKLCLSGFQVRAITNHNEVTYHFLRSIFEHLHITKGGAGGAQGMPAAAAGGFGNPVGGGNWGGAPQQQPGGGATTFAGAGAADGCQSAVLTVFQSVNTEQGMHVEEVYNKLAGQYNKAQIDQAVSTLQNDAHLYTTIDDFHYKST